MKKTTIKVIIAILQGALTALTSIFGGRNK